MKKYTLLIILFGVIIHPLSTQAVEQVVFDDEYLKSRGIDVSIAKHFSKSPVFLPGKQEVKVYVNNQFRADANVDIDDHNQPCLNADLLSSIGLNNPLLITQKQSCFKINELWKNGEIILKPSKRELWFFVPESAVALNFEDKNNYIYGGNGVIANYIANYMGSSESDNSDLYYVNNELGANFNNWLFRSYQIYNHITDSEFMHQYAYVQTTLESQKKNIQIGQINLNNSVVGTSRIIGLQLFPEFQLENNNSGGAVVSGVATEPSMVEIYQSGRLIYNTAVPPGAFELTQFNLVNRTADLQVKLKGVNGKEQQFTVPAATFTNYSPIRDSGFSFGIGRYDEEHADNRPLVTSFSKGWGVNRFVGLQFGALAVPDYYYSAGVNSSITLRDSLFLNIDTNIARDDNHHKTGELLSTSLTYSTPVDLSFGINGLIQSSSYRYLNNAVTKIDDANNKQKQIGGDISWSNTTLGTFGTSVGRTYSIDNSTQDYVNLSWSKSIFEHVNFSASYQRNYNNNNSNNKHEDIVYLNLSIPLDKANLASWFTRQENNNRWGTRYNNYADRDRNWGIAYDYSDKNSYQSVSANMNTITPYTQLGGSIRRDSEHFTTWGVSLTGGVAAVKEGILFSPYEIRDTFGIAKAGDRRFVRLDTGAGTTWTNGDGYAVIPSLNPYRKNALKVDPKSVSRNSDIMNAFKTVIPAKGSVVPVEFTIIDARRVSVHAVMNGKPLPQDSVISDEAGNFLTLATKPGQFFLGQAAPDMKLHIETPEKQQCVMQLSLPKVPESDVLYEEVNQSCH